MEGLRKMLRRALGALALRDEVYREVRDAPDAVEQGVMLIVTVGLIGALAGVVGASLEMAAMPDIVAIQERIGERLFEMPWALELSPRDLSDAREGAKAGMEQSRMFISMFKPNPIMALTSVVTKPIGMIVSWLVYGVLAFGGARLLGGRGTLSQTYGTTALAASPQVFGLFHLLPYVGTAGLGMWALICNYLALKHTHELSPGRAIWATLTPFILLIVLVPFLAMLVLLPIGLLVGGLR